MHKWIRVYQNKRLNKLEKCLVNEINRLDTDTDYLQDMLFAVIYAEFGPPANKKILELQTTLKEIARDAVIAKLADYMDKIKLN